MFTQMQALGAQLMVGVLPFDNPGINPNKDGLPGVALAQKMAGGLLVLAFIGCFVALVLSAIVWAMSSYSSNAHGAERGKKGVLVALVASLLVGGANVLVGTFSGFGASLS